MNEKTTPLLAVLLIVAAFAIGSMGTKIQLLQRGSGSLPAPVAVQQPSAAQPSQPTQPTAPAVSLDKIKPLFADGYMHFGDASKKVLFVEISDPSCPFCHIASGLNPELNKQSGGQFLMKADGGTYVPPVPE